MDKANTLNVWSVKQCPNPHATLRLFCFPYAGGSASVFKVWPSLLPPSLEVCAIQLPGRESRLMETAYKRLVPLISSIADALLPVLDKPFAFFGHSMGALICFELVRHLRRQGKPQPIHLFVSAARAPHIPNPELPIHQLPDEEFAEALKNLKGTHSEVLQNKELMELALPYLRADFEVYETSLYKPEEPLSMPITVFGGWQDNKVSSYELSPWREHTLNTCTVHMIAGNHFFLNNSREQLLQTLSKELKFYLD